MQDFFLSFFYFSFTLNLNLIKAHFNNRMDGFGDSEAVKRIISGWFIRACPIHISRMISHYQLYSRVNNFIMVSLTAAVFLLLFFPLILFLLFFEGLYPSLALSVKFSSLLYSDPLQFIIQCADLLHNLKKCIFYDNFVLFFLNFILFLNVAARLYCYNIMLKS